MMSTLRDDALHILCSLEKWALEFLKCSMFIIYHEIVRRFEANPAEFVSRFGAMDKPWVHHCHQET